MLQTASASEGGRLVTPDTQTKEAVVLGRMCTELYKGEGSEAGLSQLGHQTLP